MHVRVYACTCVHCVCMCVHTDIHPHSLGVSAHLVLEPTPLAGGTTTLQLRQASWPLSSKGASASASWLQAPCLSYYMVAGIRISSLLNHSPSLGEAILSGSYQTCFHCRQRKWRLNWILFFSLLSHCLPGINSNIWGWVVFGFDLLLLVKIFCSNNEYNICLQEDEHRLCDPCRSVVLLKINWIWKHFN